MRLSRKALATLGGVSGLAIGGALLYALQPTAPKVADNLYDSDSPNKSDLVTGAPADYGKIPKLGDPLPGDLGRPILAARRDGEIVPVPPIGASPSAERRAPDRCRGAGAHAPCAGRRRSARQPALPWRIGGGRIGTRLAWRRCSRCSGSIGAQRDGPGRQTSCLSDRRE